MENKVCFKCNIAKTIDNFRIKKNGYIFTVCKDCEYKENMERYYRKKMSNPKYVENKKIEIENTKLQKQGLKKCMVCKQIKQLTEFYFRKDTNTYRSWCIDCEKNRTKNFYKINKDEILDKQHQHYKDNRIILLERKKKYAQEHKEELREYHTKYIYNRRKNDDVFHFNINNTGGEILVSSEYPVFTASSKGQLGFLIPALNGTARFRYFCKTQKH